jgi:hypothetical protein
LGGLLGFGERCLWDFIRCILPEPLALEHPSGRGRSHRGGGIPHGWARLLCKWNSCLVQIATVASNHERNRRRERPLLREPKSVDSALMSSGRCGNMCRCC